MQHSVPGRSLLALGMVALVGACTADENLQGQETGPCLDGQCLEGLQCLSDLCVDPDDPGPDGTETSSEASTTRASGSNTSTQGSTSNPDTGPGGSTDDPAGATTDPSDESSGGSVSCGSLDVLLVVDNSASMASKQARFRSALPEFFDDLVAVTGSDQHHVMVVDTDAWVFEGCVSVCALIGSCFPMAADQYVCGETLPMECEDVLGAGVSFPRGSDAANEDCGLPDGQRYANLGDADAREQIECAAQVGTGSTTDPELPMEAMLAAVGAVGRADDCNAGFARDGVPLVVVFITDEEESTEDSMVTPRVWHDSLVAARGGDASAIAVLGLIGDTGEEDAVCPPLDVTPDGAEASPRLAQFITSFAQRGVRGSVCADEYGQSFAELTAVVETLCEP